MKAFNPYVSHLEELLLSSAWLPLNSGRQQMIGAALDGQPSAELRKRVSLDRLRAAGVFFTGSRMARKAIAMAFPTMPADAVILDPACGVGDLLVAFVGRLACSNDLVSPLSQWAKRIKALDVQAGFVRAAKLRLALAAVRRHDHTSGFHLGEFASYLIARLLVV